MKQDFRIGALSLLFEAGFVRQIRLGQLEVLRGIYPAVRDANWGTVAPVLADIKLESHSNHLRLEFMMLFQRDEIDFRAQCCLTAHFGSKKHWLEYEFFGTAHSQFWRNRIGFCVLHPMSLAGKAVWATTTDGVRHATHFPSEFVAVQPIPDFANLAVLEHSPSPSLTARVFFAGETFETEDQRNWTDASFKTFCTPLALPFPVQIQAGETVRQHIRLELEGNLQALGNDTTVDLTALPQTLPLPRIGLELPAQAISQLESERLAGLPLHHLRLDVSSTDWTRLPSAVALNLPLEVALTVSETAYATELETVREKLKTVPNVVRVLLYCQNPKAQLQPILTAAQALLPNVIAGVNTDYIFLASSRPPEAAALAFAINPQVHAFDDLSLLETLEAQQAMVQDALHYAREVVVSPVTLKPRWNPYATQTAAVIPPDARQTLPFAAAWLLGSLNALSSAGASSITYFATHGAGGVQTEQAVFPLYFVLRLVLEFGGVVRCVDCSQPQRVQVLWLERVGSTRLLLANSSALPQPLEVRLPQPMAWVRVLDASTWQTACQSAQLPEAMHQSVQALHLEPYSLLCLDFLEEP